MGKVNETQGIPAVVARAKCSYRFTYGSQSENARSYSRGPNPSLCFLCYVLPFLVAFSPSAIERYDCGRSALLSAFCYAFDVSFGLALLLAPGS